MYPKRKVAVIENTKPNPHAVLLVERRRDNVDLVVVGASVVVVVAVVK